MTAAIWLFGAIGDLIPVIITVIVIVLSLLNQLFKGQKNQPPVPKPPDRQRPPPRRKAPDDLSGEIEEFLQRAQQRQGQQQPRPAEAARAGQPAPVLTVDRPPAKRAQRERKPQKPPRPLRPAEANAPISAEVVQAEIAARPLAVAAVSAFDDDGSRSLRSGELKPTEAAFAGPSETQGRDDPGALGQTALVQLLTSADSLREAIIISEILRRPEERWS